MVWLDDERGSGKKTDVGEDAFKIRPLIREGAQKMRRHSVQKNCWQQRVPCSSPHVVSHLVRKWSSPYDSILCVLSTGLWKSSSTIACIFRMVRGLSGSDSVVAAEACSRSRRLWMSGPLRFVSSCTASCQLQPDISSEHLFKEKAGVTATRFSDLCRLGRLDHHLCWLTSRKYFDTFAQIFVWKKEQDEVRRRKRGQVEEGNMPGDKFSEVEKATSERLDKISKNTSLSLKY